MQRFLVFGVLFGFVLSRAGATSYDAIQGMFLLEDLHLMGVMGVAIALSAIGYRLFLSGVIRPRDGKAPNLKPKPMQRGLVAGSMLFGIGWGLSGTCPGTAIAQVGEGTLAGGLTLMGILLGARLQNTFTAWRAQRHTAPAETIGHGKAA